MFPHHSPSPATHPARALALTLALAIGIAGCTSETAPQSETATTAAVPSSDPTPPAAPSVSAPATPTVGVGLPSLPDYPVEVSPDASWMPGEAGPGTLAFTTSDGVKVISVHALDSLANTPEADVPADVAAFLREQRGSLSVSDERSVTQSGLPAQRFRLAMKDGRAPTDLWQVRAGSRYKPLEDEPMEVVAVRSSQGLVLLWTEWQPEDEAATLAAFDAALERVTVR